MEEYQRNKMASLLALRAFPRSFGMIVAGMVLVFTLDPLSAISYGLGVWFFVYLIKSIFIKPDFVDTYLWSCLSTIILAIGVWLVRSLIYIGLVVFALVRGAPVESTTLYMGGLLVYDLIIVVTRRS